MHIVTNLLLRTHHFCDVVLELDFLSYCSTDEYPEELDRLIIFNTYFTCRDRGDHFKVVGLKTLANIKKRVCLNVAGRDSREEVAGAGAGAGKGRW